MKNKKILIGSIIVTIITILFLVFNIRIVGVGEVGIKTQFGNVKPDVLSSGIYIKSPFERVKKFNIKLQREDIKTNGASKDLQDVTLEIALNYSLNPDMVKELYKNIGLDYTTIVLKPIGNETIKSIVSQYSAEELIVKRQEVSHNILQSLVQKLNPKGINVDNVNIINLNFSEAFNAAIEAKQVAQQEAQKAEQELEKAKIEAEEKIVRAEAEAKGYELKNKEITDKTLQMMAIEKWDGKLPSVSGSEGLMINLPQI